MICTCKHCGEQVGEHEAMGRITMMARGSVPLLVASFAYPLFDGISRRVPWEKSAPLLVGMLLLWAWLAFAMFAPSYYSWLWFTLFKPCPNCKRRKWTEGHYSGFGL